MKKLQLSFFKFKIYYFVSSFLLITIYEESRRTDEHLVGKFLLYLFMFPVEIINKLYLDIFFIFFLDIKNFISSFSKRIFNIKIILSIFFYYLYSNYVIYQHTQNRNFDYSKEFKGSKNMFENAYLYIFSDLLTIDIDYWQYSCRFILTNLLLIFILLYSFFCLVISKSDQKFIVQ